MLVNKLLERNISEMFKIDPFETIFLLEEYMEQCENIKHLIQLNEVLEYFNEKLEDRQ
jgi:hypothetical protein